MTKQQVFIMEFYVTGKELKILTKNIPNKISQDKPTSSTLK